MLPGFLLLLPALALVACHGEPRVPPTAYDVAKADTAIRALRIIKIWDMAIEPLEERHLFISHFVEVEVEEGPDRGAQLTLPYDDRARRGPPPKVGSRVVVAPATWVTADGDVREPRRPR